MAMASSFGRAGREGNKSTCYRDDWSQLHTDLLTLIAVRIVRISDFIHFRSVCRQWRCAGDPKLLGPQPPLLLLPRDSASARCSFLSISTNSFLDVDMPEVVDQVILSAAHGWLVLVDHKTRHLISLLNPVTRAMFRLDPTPYPISDPILTSSPEADDCVVIVFHIYDGFSFCRPGVHKEWTTTRTHFPLSRGAVHYNGRLIFSDVNNNVFAVDLDMPPEVIKWPAREDFLSEYILEIRELKLEEIVIGEPSWLMKAGEKMFICGWSSSFSNDFAMRFTIYGLDLNHEDRPAKWIEVESIEDFALFDSAEQTSACCVKYFPELRKNCIYFTSSRRRCSFLGWNYGEPRQIVIFLAEFGQLSLGVTQLVLIELIRCQLNSSLYLIFQTIDPDWY